VSITARVPALAPFQIRSFRFQWPADLLASWAFEMEGVILGWFVLVSTGSVLALVNALAIRVPTNPVFAHFEVSVLLRTCRDGPAELLPQRPIQTDSNEPVRLP
jgi:hypothetical protein